MMEACDKLWAEIVKSDPKYLPWVPPHIIFEKGFRAALECITDKMNTNRFMDNGELRTFIEKELEE